jgi:pantoate--beta-alanine ligase
MSGTVALVGPGRAGVTIALALLEQGWRVTRVAGRELGSASVADAALMLGATPSTADTVGLDASVVVIATPDDLVATTALQLAPSLAPDALVLHCSGSLGLRVLQELQEIRPDIRLGAMHPLVSIPNVLLGLDRLRTAWCAVAGDPQVGAIAASIGMHPFPVDDVDRSKYHAAASIAANHLVALLGQVQRVSTTANVPFEAFLPLIRSAIDNVAELGPRDALTGPVARGDAGTVSRHLASLPEVERESYLALAREVYRLSGRSDPILEAMLELPEHGVEGETPGPVVVIETVAELRAACDAARRTGANVGLVPTMGFLHEGHRSLMRKARAENDLVVLTIFVNPLQFAAGEDLSKYPRDLDGDLDAAAAEGVDIVFAPTVAEMYPEPTLTTVHVDRLTEGLCGAARPTHFDGVTTVVAKLFSIVGSSTAYFGRKDAQQLAVVARMADDLNLPVTVVGCPLVREIDGLAMSSRNAYLSPGERRAALAISRGLEAAATAIDAGERDAASLSQTIQAILAEESTLRAEYVEVRDARTLEPVPELAAETLIAVAAHVGKTRLIDNMTVRFDGTTATCDLGLRTA